MTPEHQPKLFIFLSALRLHKCDGLKDPSEITQKNTSLKLSDVGWLPVVAIYGCSLFGKWLE